tara:strand:- start:240 stop:659 length:420 start_codon:yes stop_codon:yes gene_type:complete
MRFFDILIEHSPSLFRKFHRYMMILPGVEYPFDEPNIGNIVKDFLIDPAVFNQALIVASSNSCPQFVKLFLELGADVNATNETGGTALVGALLEENLEIIKLLVEAGSKLSEDYYEAASEMYGEEYTKPLRVAYGRTLN